MLISTFNRATTTSSVAIHWDISVNVTLIRGRRKTSLIIWFGSKRFYHRNQKQTIRIKKSKSWSKKKIWSIIKNPMIFWSNDLDHLSTPDLDSHSDRWYHLCREKLRKLENIRDNHNCKGLWEGSNHNSQQKRINNLKIKKKIELGNW